MESRNSSMDDKVEDLAEVIEKFLNISNASDARQILEKYPELLSDDADSMLDALTRNSQNRETIENILYCRNLIALCREVGISQAFEEPSSSSNDTSIENLHMILEEINNLSRPKDIPRKIVMIQHALSLIIRQLGPELWAALQLELGNSLAQNPHGNRDDNIDKAIEHYNQALEVFTQKDFPVNWAGIKYNLATIYRDRTRGDRTENIETAIEYYNQSLNVRTCENFPAEWALTHNDLASAYFYCIQGDKAENIEQAINHYNQVLKVRTYEDFPVEWADTQKNLGLVHWNRIKGDKVENIEQTIEHFSQALDVYTRNDLSIEKAGVQHNLGVAYLDRIKGNKVDNIEQAIEYFNKALNVYTPIDFKVDWAMTQNNLGLAYWNRIKGDRVNNIEQAIRHYDKALEVYTQKDFEGGWAKTQNNLGLAYWDRIKGDRADNLEEAIEHYSKALDIYTYENFKVEWSEIQNNLGLVYYDRIKGNLDDNIDKAIKYFRNALKVRKKKAFKIERAMTLNNLANAYNYRIRGDRAENIEKAIKYYNRALEVYTKKDFAEDWAETQNNIGYAYCNRLRGIKTKNIKQAIKHFYNAYKIYKYRSTPDEFRKTCRLLGDLYLNIYQWKSAAKFYKEAIRAGDLLYRSGLSAESKSIEVRENAHLYRNATFASCRLGLTNEALIILEGGKVRLLSEALKLKMKQPEGIQKEEWLKYEQAAENYRIATKHSDHRDEYTQWEKDVQSALVKLDTVTTVIQRYNPEFQKELDVSDILSILDSETALLTFCITSKGSVGFVVSRSKGIQPVDIPNFKTKDLDNMLFKTDEYSYITNGLIGNYLNYLNAVDRKSRRNAFEAWKNTLNDVLSSIGTSLLVPLLTELPPHIKRLIFLPSGGLFLLPLHAVPLSGGQPFCEHYCISYSSSIQMLKEMNNKAGGIEGKGLYAVINPQEDSNLVFSGFEGQSISKFFQSPQINVGEIATKATVLDRIPGRAYLHFSCHGRYNWNDPPQSGLYLAGGRTLSLADLQNDVVDMSSARLVTLSACETGITDIMRGSADEFVGLPAGFMLAGVPCVVSSLWSVPDISTAILMERFYSNHIVGEMDIPHALQDAQLWVRDLKAKQVADYVDKCYNSGKWEGESKEKIEQYKEHYLQLSEESPDEKPFQHPYYWAAFTVNGA